MLSTSLALLFLHFVADFPAQTSWMALNKSKSNLALLAHVAAYSAVMGCGLTVWYCGAPAVVAVVGLNAMAHFATDFVTSRASSYFGRTGRPTFFWWVIGFDQFLHAATLLGLADWLLP